MLTAHLGVLDRPVENPGTLELLCPGTKLWLQGGQQLTRLDGDEQAGLRQEGGYT